MTAAKRKQRETFAKLRDQIRNILGTYIYAEGDVTLEEVVGKLLLEKNQTLALAESCTGGLISHRITRIAGSSAYYFGGAVTYANEAKMQFLGVQPATLEKHGAVSEQTALEMSRGIRERTGASIGAQRHRHRRAVRRKPGKTGRHGLDQHCRRRRCHEARLWQFHGDRERIILGTSQAALNWLRLRSVKLSS